MNELNACYLKSTAKYGADVISRIQFTTENKDGLKILQDSLIEAINQQLTKFINSFER